MDLYSNYSREDLIKVIKELQDENHRLLSEKEPVDIIEENPYETIQHKFKEKYAIRILDSLPDMLTVLNHSGILVDLVSSEETNHVGESGSTIIGKDIKNLLSPEAYNNVRANLDLVAATGKVSTSHHDITINNNTHHYENRIFPLDNEYALCMCRDVTEENVIKDELEQANRRMTNAEDIASLNHWYYYEETDEIEAPKLIPLLVGTKDKVITRCNKQTFLSYVNLNDRKKLTEQLASSQKTDDYTEFRIFLQGELHYFHSRIIHTYKKNGFWVIEGYTQDMTYIVERLHELESVKYALSNVAEEIYACNLDGSLTFANKQFRSRNNLSGSLSDHKIYEFEIPGSNQRQWKEKIAEIRANNGSAQYTTRYPNDKGQFITLETVTYIISDRDSGVETIWSFSRDITIGLERENQIKELNYVMNTILNNIPVYLFVKDPGNEFRYLYWNKAFAEHSKIPEAKAIGKTDFEIFPNLKDAEKFRRDDLALLKQGEKVEFIEDYVAANGEKRIVNTFKVLVPSENKLPLIIGISWDITEIKNAEQELIAAKIKAEESDRLKSAFLANMSHEIRTPLNAIVGFSKLIAETDDEKEKQQYTEILDSNSELLLQLINDILDISKIEAGTLEFNYKQMNLNDLCREEFEIHKNRIKQNVQLIFDEKYENIILESDHNRLAQVLTNLINNAIKFTKQGEIRYSFDIKGNMIHFYVTDTGTGIPAEKIETIFNRFTKLNNFASGTGLGLAITKMIVEKMGGTIDVQSKENVGTIFHFTIPYKKGDHLTPTPMPQVLPVHTPVIAKGERKKILVAEDIDSNFLLLKASIGKGVDLIHAKNGQLAVELFQTESPDLILMDIKMPVMDGYDATRAIRKLSSDIPIVALTAFAFESDKEKALDAGCNDYLTKPISLTSLNQLLHKYLGTASEEK